MAIIKVANVGDEHIMTVAECSLHASQFGEQIKFVSTAGDVLYMPQTSADNQFAWLKLEPGPDYEGVHGLTLKFFRTPNTTKGGKPYWNLAIMADSDAKAKPPSKRLPSPSKAAATFMNTMPTDIPGMEEGDPGPEEPPELAAAYLTPNATYLRPQPTPVPPVGREAEQREIIRTAYETLRNQVASSQYTRYDDETMDGADSVAYDAASIQAETVSIWISWKELGIVRSLLT